MLGIAMPNVRSGKFSDPSPAIAFPTNWIFSKPIIPLRRAVPLKCNCIFFLCAACVRSSISSVRRTIMVFVFLPFFPVFAAPSVRLKQKRVSVRRWRCHLRNERWGSLQHRKEIEMRQKQRNNRDRENKQQGKESDSERRPQPPCMRCGMKQEEEWRRKKQSISSLKSLRCWQWVQTQSGALAHIATHSIYTQCACGLFTLCFHIFHREHFFHAHFSVNSNWISFSSR